jgi:hypothetical protein
MIPAAMSTLVPSGLKIPTPLPAPLLNVAVTRG